MFATFLRNDATTPTKISLVALILRLSLAVIFLIHGIDKVRLGHGGSYWVDRMYERMPEMQLPVSLTYSGTQMAVAWGEILGGLALAAGLLTRLAAIGMIVIQVGAVCLVTAPRGFYFEKGGGYEYNLALLAMCLALLILGPGAWSLDWLLTRRRIRAAGGVTASTPPLAGPHVLAGQPIEQIAPGPTGN